MEPREWADQFDDITKQALESIADSRATLGLLATASEKLRAKSAPPDEFGKNIDYLAKRMSPVPGNLASASTELRICVAILEEVLKQW